MVEWLSASLKLPPPTRLLVELEEQEAQLLLGDRETRKHAKNS